MINTGDLHSFADSRNSSVEKSENKQSRRKSKITLANSNSASTIKRIAKRYQKEQKIVVFEDGVEISNSTPCFVIELNSLLMKYYMQQKGPSEYTTYQEDVNSQIRMYQRAVSEILDQCSSRLYNVEDLSPEEKVQLDGAPPRVFNRLYSVYGQQINSLIEIEEDVCMMIAGDKGCFQGLKTSELF